MGKKSGMYCYYDWIEPLKKVPVEDFKDLVISMLEYHKDGTHPPDFNGVTGMAAAFIFPQIDRSKIYAQNGAKGGLATQSKTVASTNALTNGSTLIHNTKTNTKTDNNTSLSDMPPKVVNEYEKRFERFWEEYPRKVGKTQAKKYFMKIRPSEDLLKVMIASIKTQKQSEQWTKERGQFIPHPSTWLNRGQWEDTTEETYSPFCKGVEDYLDDLF